MSSPAIASTWVNFPKMNWEPDEDPVGFPCFICIEYTTVQKGEKGEEDASQILKNVVYIKPNLPVNYQQALVGGIISFTTFSTLTLDNLLTSFNLSQSTIAIENYPTRNGFFIFALKMPNQYSAHGIKNRLKIMMQALKMHIPLLNEGFNVPIPPEFEKLQNPYRAMLEEGFARLDKTMPNLISNLVFRRGIGEDPLMYDIMTNQILWNNYALSTTTNVFTHIKKTNPLVYGLMVLHRHTLVLSSFSNPLTVIFMQCFETLNRDSTHQVPTNTAHDQDTPEADGAPISPTADESAKQPIPDSDQTSVEKILILLPEKLINESSTDTKATEFILVLYSSNSYQLNFFFLIKVPADMTSTESKMQSVDPIIQEIRSFLDPEIPEYAKQCSMQYTKPAPPCPGSAILYPHTGVFKDGWMKSKDGVPKPKTSIIDIHDAMADNQMLLEVISCTYHEGSKKENYGIQFTAGVNLLTIEVFICVDSKEVGNSNDVRVLLDAANKKFLATLPDSLRPTEVTSL